MRLNLDVRHVSLGEISVTRQGPAAVETVSFSVTIAGGLVSDEVRSRVSSITEIMFTGVNHPGAPMRLQAYPGPWPVRRRSSYMPLSEAGRAQGLQITFDVVSVLPIRGPVNEPQEGFPGPRGRRPALGPMADGVDLATIAGLSNDLSQLLKEAYTLPFDIPLAGSEAGGGVALTLTVDAKGDRVRITRPDATYLEFPLTALVSALLDPDARRVVSAPPSQVQPQGANRRRRAVRGND